MRGASAQRRHHGDKEELAEKCAALTAELNSAESLHKERSNKQALAEKRELKRQKDLWIAAEKVRRDVGRAVHDGQSAEIEPLACRISRHA